MKRAYTKQQALQNPGTYEVIPGTKGVTEEAMTFRYLTNGPHVDADSILSPYSMWKIPKSWTVGETQTVRYVRELGLKDAWFKLVRPAEYQAAPLASQFKEPQPDTEGETIHTLQRQPNDP